MNSKYWLAFASIEEISSSFTKKLYEHFNDIQLAWHASPQELAKIEDLTKKQVENFLLLRQNINPDEKLEYIESKEISHFSYEDANYPELLKNIDNPPMTMFYKGDLERCNLSRMLAVVGSRNLSMAAKDNLKQILSGFINTDLTIVSGGALGADTAAHEAAIANNLSTMCVIGSGFDKIYPAKNKALFEKISGTHGVMMTEYWPTFEPIAWRFPQRNRIVSGLCQGALIVEAALKSGALITAGLALEQGRELMCIPGAISNPNTEGIYKLLKQGATLVTTADDILSALSWDIKINKTSSTRAVPENLNEIELEIYDLISKDNLTIDEIFNTLSLSKLNISDLMVILTTLEIRGLIKTAAGDKYTLAV